MKTANAPKVGWGILTPDSELSPNTLAIIEQLRSLPDGQKDALLARAVPRYLHVQEDLQEGMEPDSLQMVGCTSALHNWLDDIIGLP